MRGELVINTKRFDDENVNQYKLRLCRNKEILELTWPQIGELISAESGVAVSGDTIRKEFTSYERGFLDGQSEQINDEELMQQLEMKKLELQKLKFKISDQRTQLNKSLRAESRFEDIKELLVKEIKELAKVKPLENTSGIKFNRTNKSSILALSDWHRGVNADNQVNRLDDNEFRARVEKLLQDTIKYGKEQNVSDMHVALAGDLIHGVIHVAGRVTSYEDVVKQITTVSEILTYFLIELSKHFNIYVYSVLDNHSRIISNKSESVDSENLMAFIPWYLKARLASNNNIKFVNDCQDNVLIDVVGSNVLCVHGHYDKPESVRELSSMLGVNPDCVVLGHFHNPQNFELQGLQVVVNGSLCGTESYAYSIRRYAVPSQKLLIFEEGKQGVVCEYNIRVAEKRVFNG